MKATLTTDNYNGQLQSALGSGFCGTSTSMEVMEGIDLRGKVAVVTGGYAGIGLETVKAFVRAGAEVWVPARDIAKAEKNISDARVIVKPMDLMNPVSIDQFATAFLGSGKSLDILVNNAGIMWVPLRRDSRGFESQLATNHLGHFQLTARLWPALKRSGSARVVTVSSYGHHMAPFDFVDPNFNHREYHTLQGYGQSKTANNLFTVELDKRAQEFGVRAYAVHPGAVNGTDLGREAPIELFKQMGTHDADGNIYPEVAKRLKTVSQGAATTLWCATNRVLSETGGVYCEDCDIAQLDNGDIEQKYDDPSLLRGVLPYSLEENNARALWAMSEEMTDLRFPVI
jgi:NAD(P)-dependent dehydrogenase (short-subunit alcohol dehydrogenase family)